MYTVCGVRWKGTTFRVELQPLSFIKNYLPANDLGWILLLEIDVHLVRELGQLRQIHFVQLVSSVVERGHVKVHLNKTPTEPFSWVMELVWSSQIYRWIIKKLEKTHLS